MGRLTKEWAAGSTPRPHIWADVPDEKWNDWRWQLSHRVNDLEVLETFINLTEAIKSGGEVNIVDKTGGFEFAGRLLLSGREREILLSAGLLNYLRKRANE